MPVAPGGLQVLRAARALSFPPEVILITAYGTPAAAVEAMREGAYDYICKPFDNAPSPASSSMTSSWCRCARARPPTDHATGVRAGGGAHSVCAMRACACRAGAPARAHSWTYCLLAASQRQNCFQRALPGRGLGHGLLRYLGKPEVAGALRALPHAQVAFNYLGQFDAAFSGSSLFAPASESPGPSIDEHTPRRHLFEVSGLVLDGCLRFSFTYSPHLHTEATVQSLADSFLASLRALLAGRASEDALRYTPADFPLAGLSQQALDRVVPPGTRVEDVYPLSPMQQGMLFHTLLAPAGGFYVVQLAWTFHSPLDVPAFKRAWQAVVERHAVLRTSFRWEGLAAPLQVVHPDAELPWEELDWRGLSEAQQAERFTAHLAADRTRGFELSCAPLMRLAVVRLDEGAHRVLWSQHHLLLDGWSCGLLLKEVLSLYEDFRAGRPSRLERPPPYRDYLAWLQQKPLEEAEAHWRHVLRGFSTPTPVPMAQPAHPGGASSSKGQCQRRLSPDTTAALHALARQHQLALNSVLQGAWALLLGRYSGEPDVVFGATVSGRPAELPGAERMVGLFINSLPVRVLLSGDDALVPWLQRLQAQQLELRQYEHTPLVRMQGASDVPRGAPLFETLFTFENYPLDDTLRNLEAGVDIRDVAPFEQTNNLLDAVVAPGPQLGLQLSYDAARLDAVTAGQLLAHWAAVLEAMAARPEQRLGDVQLLSEAERRRLLVEWNDTRADYPRDACIHHLFEAQVERTPDATAVEFEGTILSYRQLDGRADRLAHHLRKVGVRPETPVALCVERSVELVLGMLAILKAGGAYVPLDPDHPRERLSFILEDSRAPGLLTQQHPSPRWRRGWRPRSRRRSEPPPAPVRRVQAAPERRPPPGTRNVGRPRVAPVRPTASSSAATVRSAPPLHPRASLGERPPPLPQALRRQGFSPGGKACRPLDSPRGGRLESPSRRS